MQIDRQTIKDGVHWDADGSVVSSDEFLSSKKIRGMLRSLYRVAEEKSLWPGIFFRQKWYQKYL